MTAREPIAPEAPGWFSTTTGWPHLLLRLCAIMRASTSVPPPAANGTIILMACSGYSPAEDGEPAAQSSRTSETTRTHIIGRPKLSSRLLANELRDHAHRLDRRRLGRVQGNERVRLALELLERDRPARPGVSRDKPVRHVGSDVGVRRSLDQ